MASVPELRFGTGRTYQPSRFPTYGTIAEQNDAFRRSFTVGQVFVTRGIAALPPSVQDEIIGRVRAFDAFGPDNDPHGEHDFGSFEHSGRSIFWKIDCYDTRFKWGSPDPANPAVTRCLLTILLAEEY